MNEKIFIFSSVHRWDDTRLLHKQATSLAKRFNVELHAPAKFNYREDNRICIFGLLQWDKVSDRKNIRNVLWKRISQSNADIYHFHDPELLWIGIKISVILKKKVIYDIHEDYERAILTKKWIPRYFRLLISKLFYLFEQGAVRIINNIICTTEPISNKFKSNNINKEIIYNFPLTPSKKPDFQKKDKSLIIYVGGITKIRGFNEIIQALSFIKSNFRFIVIGPIHDSYKKELIKKIKNSNLTNKIEFKGLLPYNNIFKYIEQAIVGILCYLPVPNHLVTFPNKIFEYISQGTAVIASDFPLYRQVINNAQCGLLINPSDPVDIAKSISYALNNSEEMISYGINGYNAIHKYYNWENEEVKLHKYYAQLLSQKFRK